jgi:hypothetical protein
MIKKIILPLLAVLLLGSCASKFSLVKRKYNKGFFVNVSKPNHPKQADNGVSAVANTKETVPVSKEEVIVSTRQVQEISQQAAGGNTSQGLTKRLQPSKESKQVYASAEKNVIKTINAIKPLLQKEKNSAKGSDASSNKILLIILALFPFICLIAIYLHDGKKVTLNFWITLLLHLTFVLWLVFALLVVLDVIDLA